MQLYKEAAQILRRICQKEGTVKTLVYSSTYQNLKELFALVSECVKHQPILVEVLGQCDPSLIEDQLIDNDESLAIVLLYEFLIGRGFGRAGFIRKAIVKHKAQLKAAYRAALENHNSFQDSLQERQGNSSITPRYARVNLASLTVSEVIERLRTEGWIYDGTLQSESFATAVASLGESNFGLDPLMDDLLVFPPGTDLHNHPLVMSGNLVLQDKASCIPAHMLAPGPGSVVLDCCAAPGNKTCHLASLMGDKGQVIALDRDSKRFATMKRLLDRSGFTCIETINQDFLTISPFNEDCLNIEKILVDPSCSGSGMAGTRISPSDDHVDSMRLSHLKRFQIMILKHALRFPNARRVVYSTCSIHQQENEEVVEEVMEHVKEYFQFKPVYPELTNSRGLKRFLHHKDFLRLSPEKDLTNGFFVACFERIKSAEKLSGENEVLNGSEAVSSSKEQDEEQEVPVEVHSCDDTMETMDKKEREGKGKKRVKGNEHCHKSLICSESTNEPETPITDEGVEEKDKRRERKRKKRAKENEKCHEKSSASPERSGERATSPSESSMRVDTINNERRKTKRKKRVEEKKNCPGESLLRPVKSGEQIDVVISVNKDFSSVEDDDDEPNSKKERKRKKKSKKHQSSQFDQCIGQESEMLSDNMMSEDVEGKAPKKKKAKKMKKEKRKKEKKERRDS